MRAGKQVKRGKGSDDNGRVYISPILGSKNYLSAADWQRDPEIGET